MRQVSIDAYEGLVFRTAQMFYERVGLELDDMRQELRIKVLTALRSYDPTRSTMSEKAYVYALVANRVKDLKRDAARRAGAPLSVGYIEDWRRDPDGWDKEGLARFEFLFCHSSPDEVFGVIDNPFVMPATITDREAEIIMLLVLGYDQTEIALHLGVERWAVVKWMTQIREKLADWRPTPQPVPQPQCEPVAA